MGISNLLTCTALIVVVVYYITFIDWLPTFMIYQHFPPFSHVWWAWTPFYDLRGDKLCMNNMCDSLWIVCVMIIKFISS